MLSVYVHIPFCKSRCLYCDFFSTTQLDLREQYVQALILEAHSRLSTLDSQLSTIYFGGGTPSMLSVEQIRSILSAINPTNAIEITLEANPGDLTIDKLQALRAIGINRLSIGIQSFRDEELQLLGRRHNAQQAIEAVYLAQQAGFDNISIDLMYALPNQTLAGWQSNIRQALDLHVQHISCYCLTYEPHTPLTQLVEKGQLTPMDEDTENQMYDLLCDELAANGFEHYEVSNFALKDCRSRHNSGYWNDTPYIGLGAGAHSYDGTTRRWNIDNLQAYINGLSNGSQYWEEEHLTPDQKTMEYIMLGLRTSDGIPINPTLQTKAQPHIDAGRLMITPNRHLVATQT